MGFSAEDRARFLSSLAAIKRGKRECWNWTGMLDKRGYGRFSRGGRQFYVHRISYQIHAPIPPGLTLDHLCRKKSCCNPVHLEPVTQGENARRYFRTITHCPSGHEYTPANTYVHPKTHKRKCRHCARIYAKTHL